MIDVESQIFTKVYDAVISESPECQVLSTTTLLPTQFPCVCCEESDNYPLLTRRDTSTNEHDVAVMYEVNVFTNNRSGKKEEAKKLFNVVDGVFDSLGFTRQSKMPINVDSSSIYRIVARYTATVSKDEIIYRR